MQLKSLQDIERRHRHIFLSPHYDDVVFACGGTLEVQVSCGLRPLVITVFGGSPAAGQSLSPLAREVHQGMGIDSTQSAEQVVAIRRQEDAAALDLLQVDYLWLDYPEAIYRGNPPYYHNIAEVIGGEIHQADQSIDRELATDLLALQERLPDAVWYAPLAIGRHVDHQIVCSAVDRLVQHGAKVNFYEDFPYVTREGAREARINELGQNLEYKLVEMSEMLPLRLEAADLYTSQIKSNFGSREAMQKMMREYTHSIRPVETVHLERYWTIG